MSCHPPTPQLTSSYMNLACLFPVAFVKSVSVSVTMRLFMLLIRQSRAANTHIALDFVSPHVLDKPILGPPAEVKRMSPLPRTVSTSIMINLLRSIVQVLSGLSMEKPSSDLRLNTVLYRPRVWRAEMDSSCSSLARMSCSSIPVTEDNSDTLLHTLRRQRARRRGS